MAILKCKMCGGDIELSADKTFGTCEFCGSTMTFPKVDDEQRAAMFNRGNHFRRIGEFDKALAVYERIVQEDEADAEAHWCCALCRFGIEYVEDPNTLEYLPTCHRASFDSFLEDVDYLAALEHSDGVTRRQYQKDAAKIAEVQRGILATSQNEEPFDVFICYKESENDGSRTRDSLYAQDIYYQLTEQGRRVFFSRITLEDKAGTEYEPYIFAALNSAKVMILVTTSADHANAVWVKNEWSRFLSLMRKDRTKLLLPCYRDMDPYDLPEALSVLQSYDMSKIGFIQDLTRGINKVLDGAKPKQTAKETVVIQQQSGYAAPLLERAFMFLEDGDWAKADDFCEQVLNLEPKNALAYLGKLMAELKVRKREQLKDQAQPFDDRNNYQKALRFADGKLKAELSGIISFINDRNETSRKEGIYQQALAAIERESVEGYKEAARLFESVPDYKDSADRAKECLEQVIIIPKKNTYQAAIVMMANGDENDYRSAASMFKSITGYKDAVAMEKECLEKAEFARKEKLYQKSISLDYSASQISTRLSADWGASNALDGGISRATDNWFSAIEGFKSLGEFKDSQEQADTCVEKLYSFLCSCLEKSRDLHQLQVASESFQKLGNYKYALDKAQICSEKKEACRKDMLYSSAIKTMNEAGLSIDSLELAIREFRSVSGWQNADELAETCRRRIEQIKAQAEAARIEAERKAEAERLEAKRRAEAERLEAERRAEAERKAENNKKKRKKIFTALFVVFALLAIAAFFYWNSVVKPQRTYNQAVELYAAGQYEEAISTFSALNGYKDSAAQIEACQTVIKSQKYDAAVALYNTGKYEEAILVFSALNGYKDSANQIAQCKIAINDQNYANAVALYEAEQYAEALTAFEALNGYRDSDEQINKCKTAINEQRYAAAMKLYETRQYDEAIAAFQTLDGYKDSAAQIEACKTAISNEKVYKKAIALLNYGEKVNYSEIAEARELLLSISGYKDSKSILSKFLYREIKYERSDFQKAYYYDSQGVLSDGWLTDRYSFDSQGRVITEKSGNGTYIYTYNDKGQVIQRHLESSKSSYSQETIYTYDTNDRLKQSQKVGVTTTKKETATKTYTDSITTTTTTSYSYNAKGLLISVTEEEVIVVNNESDNYHKTDRVSKTTKYEYDAQDRVIKETTPDLIYTITYDSQGRIQSKLRENLRLSPGSSDRLIRYDYTYEDNAVRQDTINNNGYKHWYSTTYYGYIYAPNYVKSNIEELPE